MGARHRDHITTGSTVRKLGKSTLALYFFGQDKTEKLTIDKFLDFQEQLNNDILWLEFNRREPDNGRISEVEFGDMLLMHAGMPDKRKQRMLKRVKRMCKDESLCPGVTFEEVMKFFYFLNHIADVDTALTFYQMAGANVDQEMLRHVAKTVAGVDIAEDVIRMIYALFDENQDGELSNREFVSVMKRRLMRGLEKPKDTGFVKILSAFYKCAKDKTAAHY